MVERIRTDELIHVESLRVYLGELRELTFRKIDGGTKPGRDIIDPLWERLVRWATIEQPPVMAEEQRKMLYQRVHAHPDGARIWREIESLADAA